MFGGDGAWGYAHAAVLKPDILRQRGDTGADLLNRRALHEESPVAGGRQPIQLLATVVCGSSSS